jgi:hypothetical protein
MAKKDSGKILLYGVLALALLSALGVNFLSVYPLDNTAYVGLPFDIRFFSGTYEISHSGECPNMASGTAFLVQTITTRDDDSGENWGPVVRNGQPLCSASSYQWPDFSFTPLYAHHYTITSQVKDGTTNVLLNTDTWPFQVQAATQPECTVGQKRCDFASTPDRLVTCDSSGHYTQWGNFCQAGCTDPGNGNAFCNNVCAPGTYQCTSEVQYQYCNPDGLGWGGGQICQYTFPLPTRCIAGGVNPCVQASPRCGDGICSAGSETSATCSADCAGGGPVCGNGVCESGETASSCVADCNVCSGDPADMDHATLCSCFPTSTQCTTTPPGGVDSTILIVLGAIIVVAVIGGLAMGGRKKR